MFAAVFLAENRCELTFSLRQMVLLFFVLVGSTMPFSPRRATEWSAGRRGSPEGVTGLWGRGPVRKFWGRVCLCAVFAFESQRLTV